MPDSSRSSEAPIVKWPRRDPFENLLLRGPLPPCRGSTSQDAVALGRSQGSPTDVFYSRQTRNAVSEVGIGWMDGCL